LSRAFELKIHRPEIKDLLHTGPGVEKGQKQSMIPAAIGGTTVNRIEHRADFVPLEVLDGPKSGALDGHGEKPLAGLDVLGMTSREKASQGVDGGQP